MQGRVIQGFFVGGGRLAPATVPGRATVTPGAASGGLHARSIAPAARLVQRSAAPGRPPLVHAAAPAGMRPGGAPAATLQRFGGDGSFAVDPAHVGLVRGGGTPLPRALLAKMEAAFGADFSGVRVHVGPQASRIGAIAFTTGNDLYFAPGQFQPDSVKGQQLIGHELAHVVQQRQGRVRAPHNGVAVVQDRALEAEADRLGMQAAARRSPLQPKVAGGRAAGPVAASGGQGATVAVAGLGVAAAHRGRGLVVRTVQRSAAASTSGFASTAKTCTGQIYGIWKNEEFPGKIAKSSLDAKKCIYVGKTNADDESLGVRFIQHVKDDSDRDWHIDYCDYSNSNDEYWPYVVRNLWFYKQITHFDVAVAEQYFIDTLGTAKLNKIAALTLAKFEMFKDDASVWTTKGEYKGYKPKK